MPLEVPKRTIPTIGSEEFLSSPFLLLRLALVENGFCADIYFSMKDAMVKMAYERARNDIYSKEHRIHCINDKKDITWFTCLDTSYEKRQMLSFLISRKIMCQIL